MPDEISSNGDPQSLRWDKLMRGLSPAARQHLEGPPSPMPPQSQIDEERCAFQSFSRGMPPALLATEGPEPTVLSTWPIAARPSYIVVENEDGEVPIYRVFRGQGAMLLWLASLDDKDVYAFPYYGVPIPFSRKKGRQGRLVFMPDDTVYRLVGDEARRVLTLPDEPPDIQEDHFLGLPELALPSQRPQPVADKPQPPQPRQLPASDSAEPPPPRPLTDDDEDFDDDDGRSPV